MYELTWMLMGVLAGITWTLVVLLAWHLLTRRTDAAQAEQPCGPEVDVTGALMHELASEGTVLMLRRERSR